jgi:hypothetical protein
MNDMYAFGDYPTGFVQVAVKGLGLIWGEPKLDVMRCQGRGPTLNRGALTSSSVKLVRDERENL